MNWGQYTEKRPGEIYKGREKAGKPLREMMEESKKYIMVIHCSFHWSFVVMDDIKKKLNTYDSGVHISNSHSKPHKALKESIEVYQEDDGVWDRYMCHNKMKGRAADIEC